MRADFYDATAMDTTIRIAKDSYKRFKIISTKKQMPLKYLFEDMLCRYEDEYKIEEDKSFSSNFYSNDKQKNEDHQLLKERKGLAFLKYS